MLNVLAPFLHKITFFGFFVIVFLATFCIFCHALATFIIIWHLFGIFYNCWQFCNLSVTFGKLCYLLASLKNCSHFWPILALFDYFFVSFGNISLQLLPCFGNFEQYLPCFARLRQFLANLVFFWTNLAIVGKFGNCWQV